MKPATVATVSANRTMVVSATPNSMPRIFGVATFGH